MLFLDIHSNFSDPERAMGGNAEGDRGSDSPRNCKDRKKHRGVDWEVPGRISPRLKRSVWHQANPVTLRERRLEFPLGKKPLGRDSNHSLQISNIFAKHIQVQSAVTGLRSGLPSCAA